MRESQIVDHHPIANTLFAIGDFFSALGYALDFPTSFNNAWCRFKGHPNGTNHYYSSCSYEPDYKCVDCGENIA